MSYSINALQRWLATVEHPVEVRELIDAFHQYSHKNGDALNHDRYVHRSAERLDKWLDEQEIVVLANTEPGSIVSDNNANNKVIKCCQCKDPISPGDDVVCTGCAFEDVRT